MNEVNEYIYNAAPNDELYVGVYSFLKPMLFIRDPHLAHEISVRDFNYFQDRLKEQPSANGRLIYGVPGLRGEEWRMVRNKLVPAFSSGKLKKMYSLIDECAELLVEYHLRLVLFYIY